MVLDWGPLLEAVLGDVSRGTPAGVVAGRFHNSLVEGILAVAARVGEPRVALTGGCFQNRVLTERAAARLERAGFEVVLHRRVPANDGGISLGQIAVAATRLGGGKEGTA
jgi:hydrogenase maturation protein HypF